MIPLLFVALSLPPASPAASGAAGRSPRGQRPDRGRAVALWGRWERAFDARGAADPDVALTVESTSPTGRRRAVDGFWDGGATWRVRFMPFEVGTWRYRTRCEPPVEGLHDQSGAMECRRD